MLLAMAFLARIDSIESVCVRARKSVYFHRPGVGRYGPFIALQRTLLRESSPEPVAGVVPGGQGLITHLGVSWQFDRFSAFQCESSKPQLTRRACREK
jgi:hypothetical protein